MKRRRLLGLAPAILVSCRKSDEVTVWKGIHMGIGVSVSYRGRADLEPALQEVRQAESDLTLWEQDSPLSRLNRTGILDQAPRHLLRCLAKARELFEASEGLFDPTIHSYLEWSRAEYQAGRIPDEAVAKEKRAFVDFARVDITPARIMLPKGMALSLNAIAQGYLTDVFAEAFECSSALVNFGEYRVLGESAWPVEISGRTHLLKRALAVSSGGGERLSATASANHLMDPRTGNSPPPKLVFAVEADEAWLADGLATLVALGGRMPDRYASAVQVLT
ncbi:FAD:protein FMN transferase [Verrucomicrobiaceae bacterium 227]